jgi:Autographiviridae endonuclease VII
MKPSKICSYSKCSQSNPQALEEFAPDNRRKNGLQSQCRSCQYAQVKEARRKNPEAKRAKERAYWSNNKRYFLEQKRRLALRKYWPGSTKEEAYANWLKMYQDQDKKCAICKKEEELVVDHCHVTKKVRQLLCDRCNLAFGLLYENKITIENMLKYIDKHT